MAMIDMSKRRLKMIGFMVKMLDLTVREQILFVIFIKFQHKDSLQRDVAPTNKHP